MNKKIYFLIVSIIVIIALSVGVYFYTKAQTDTSNGQVGQTSTAPPSPSNEPTGSSESSQTTPETTSTPPPRYVTLADYTAEQDQYKDVTKVYFFHAPWCHICQGIENEINDDETKIPADTTFIKADFDDEVQLRQQYGVTTQYTFVQVDNDGNKIAKWSATNLDRAVAGINR